MVDPEIALSTDSALLMPAAKRRHRPGSARRRVWMRLAGLAALFAAQPAVAGPSLTGEQIFRDKCIACHGEMGEGSREYPRVLAGDRSVEQLARLIEKTMPEDAPGECVGDDARKVAAYIHEAFYSRAAQARNKPPRIALSRLTVRQYRNAVADLVGSFRAPGHLEEPHGLKAEYYKSRRFRTSERVIQRVDPQVRFDFGVGSPDPKIEAQQFSIRWEGSVLAPETGEYEFIVRTEHAVRLWVNDVRQPLIDAWVKSGNDTEYRQSIRLLGGRVYPLQLEFSKAKQGVDDSKKKQKTKPPDVKASIALEWKPPQRAAEVIPDRNLSPSRFPETFVVTTPFPPDDRSVGYERGTAVSKAWDQATTEAAIEVATYVSTRLRELAGVDDEASDREARLRTFCQRFAERAFRRPLSDQEKQFFVERQFKSARSPDLAVKRALLLVLKSPRFLYREVGGGTDPYDVASRLSFALWDSLPDPALLEAAASGRLATREQVHAQAERMVDDLRTRAKVRAFFLQWLRVDHAPEVAKDPKLFPGFNETLVSDLRTSLEIFLDEVIWSKESDFRQLLLADQVYLNGRLARYYGVNLLPADAAFQKVSLEPAQRAGVLTHPYLMATFAYTASSSPIHRGVFIARSVLGRSLRPPPQAVAPLVSDLHAGLTTRERVALQTKPESCMGCHGMINPLGFGLEHFDAVGRYREKEKGHPIDSTGTYEKRSGNPASYNGARDLALLLAASEETHTAFVEQLFHDLVKQPIRAFGPRQSTDLQRSFAEHKYSIRNLLVDIATASALPHQELQAEKQGTGQSGSHASRR